MMRLAAILFFVVFQTSMSQDKEIQWRADEKLTWNDFQAKPDYSHPYAAITYSGISYGFSADIINGEVKVNYDINCFFVVNKSWVKKRYLNDNELLVHEQLHFDITELFVRKFRKKLSEMTFSKNVKSEIKTVYKAITKDKVKMQELYDEETDHSKKKIKQKEWEVSIASQLQNLIQFASK